MYKHKTKPENFTLKRRSCSPAGTAPAPSVPATWDCPSDHIGEKPHVSWEFMRSRTNNGTKNRGFFTAINGDCVCFLKFQWSWNNGELTKQQYAGFVFIVFLNGDGFYGDMNGKISGVCEISVGYSCYVIWMPLGLNMDQPTFYVNLWNVTLLRWLNLQKHMDVSYRAGGPPNQRAPLLVLKYRMLRKYWLLVNGRSSHSHSACFLICCFSRGFS